MNARERTKKIMCSERWAMDDWDVTADLIEKEISAAEDAVYKRAGVIASQEEMIDYPTGMDTRLAAERTQQNIVRGIAEIAEGEAL